MKELKAKPLKQPVEARLGRYLLRFKIAQGGMASIYLGELAGAEGFRRWVAIKVMHAHLAEDEGFVHMFLDEARLASQIQHPNVCQITDFGEDAGRYFLVMEYLRGETLSAVVKKAWTEQGEIAPGLVTQVVADVARGLHAAHELRGPDGKRLDVVHRDVSPQNMMVLYDGVSKIMDFGIARARSRLTTTQTGTLKGKFSYMSPEQLNGAPVDRRADVWALGVTLWEALTGKRLFRARSEGETALRVVQMAIPKPSELRAGVPEALDVVVARALERDVEARFATAGELSLALDDALRVMPRGWGSIRVGEVVQGLFAERRRTRDRLLLAEPGSGPVVELDLESVSTLGSQVQARTTPPPSDPPPAVAQEGSLGSTVDFAPVDVAPVDVAPVDVAPVDVAPVDAARALPPSSLSSAASTVAPVEAPRSSSVSSTSTAAAPIEAPRPSSVRSVAPGDAPPVAVARPSSVDSSEEAVLPSSAASSPAATMNAAPALPSSPRPVSDPISGSPTEDAGATSLRSGRETEPSGAAPAEESEPRTSRRLGWAVAAAILALGLLGAGVWVASGGDEDAEARAESEGAVEVGTGAESATESEAESATESEVGTESESGTGTESATESATETASATGTESPTETGTASATETATETETASATEASSAVTAAGGSPSGSERGAAVASARGEVARPAPVGEGTLNLMVIPRAEVRWHGRLLGTTPLVGHRLPAGRHRLHLRAVDASARRTVVVTIRAGERTAESVRLEP